MLDEHIICHEPKDPNNNTDKSNKEGEEGEWQAEKKAERPAVTVLTTAAAHGYVLICYSSFRLYLGG